MRIEFPGRLRYARELRGLRQSELSDKTGIMPASISKFESGDRIPSLDSFKRLAVALEVSADYLLGLSDSTFMAAQDELVAEFERLPLRDRNTIKNVINLFLAEVENEKTGR